MQLCTLIPLKLNIFLKKYETKSKTNQLLTKHLEYKIMNLLCVDFIWICLDLSLIKCETELNLSCTKDCIDRRS